VTRQGGHEPETVLKEVGERLGSRLKEGEAAARKARETLETKLQEVESALREAGTQLGPDLDGGESAIGRLRETHESELREREEAREQTRRELEGAVREREQALERTRAELEDRIRESEEALERTRSELEGQIKEREAELERTRSDLQGEVKEREAELERTRSELQEREQELEGERRSRAEVERGRTTERHWNNELRAELLKMHHEHGALGDMSDVRELVLRLAVTLLDAEKGLLLSREDEDGDGKLDFVAGHGFENDPSESALAQRFANEVLERDVTLREDDASKLQPSDGEKADEEIRNLVAIPIYMQDRFSGVVVCANREGGFGEYDDEVLLSVGDHAAAVLQNARLQGQLRNSYLATVGMLAEAIEVKDPFLRGHSDEVSGYVAAVADQLDVPPARREELVFGSLLHDVGKIGISERILLKPSGLTAEERTVIELHPRIGYRLVQQVPSLRPIALAILHHHERWDGTGYPRGLKGDEIPLEARIICVADSFSAMTAERPYRRRMSLEDACNELERCAATQFDPEVVRIFVEEVRCRPPAGRNELVDALHDPELRGSLEPGEPILGLGSIAVTDNLTLLYSHRYCHEMAETEAQRAAAEERPFAIVMVELADMVEVNRLEGYAAGDAAIQSVAQAIQRAAVRCGGTACRYSGRRLVLIAPGVDEPMAERLRTDLELDLRSGPAVRIVVSAWRLGDTGGEDVITRARLGLSLQDVPARYARPTPT